MAHSDSFRINIAIAAMNILSYSILYVSNEFQITNVSIHERVCVSTPPYYLDWVETSPPKFSLNKDDGPFFLLGANGIHGTKPSGRQWNIPLDSMVMILKYKKRIVNNDINIKVLSDGTVSYLTVSTDDVLSTTNNETSFLEITRVFKESFKI